MMMNEEERQGEQQQEEEGEGGSLQPRIRGLKNNQVNPRLFFQQLNTFRRHPQQFYTFISSRKQHYNKQNLYFSFFHPNKSIRTSEGREPLNQLLQELVNVPSLNPIAYNSDLNSTADDIARQYRSCHSTQTEFELNPRELRMILQRSQKYVFPHGISCVIGVGFREEYEPLISLMVDDGVASRRNRKILLSNLFEVVGIGAVPLEDPSLVCAVYLFTQSVIPKDKLPV